MKTIYTFKEKSWDTTLAPDYVIHCAEKLTLQLDAEFPHLGIYWEKQYKNKTTGVWTSNEGCFNGLFLNFKNFDFGASHWYYDGPHCLFFLGFLHLAYQPDDCDKCYSGDYDETWFKKLFKKKDKFRNFR